MQKDQNIWHFIAKNIFGEASAEEKDFLQKYLEENPGMQQQYDMLLQILNNRKSFTPHEENINDKVAHIINKASAIEPLPQIPVHYRRNLVKYWVAAAVLLIAMGALVFFNGDKQKRNQSSQKPALMAKNGSRKQTVLPDGSKVWLNAGSKLFFINDFAGNTREVKLEGEAFFDVTKNPSRPFIVHANNIDIKVLGTAFNVKAYVEDENVETTLYRGLVNITKSDDNSFQPIMLYPNQKLILPRINSNREEITRAVTTPVKSSIVIKQIDSTKVEPLRIETAWMYDRLEFRGDDFPTLANKLERWYNVKINFGDEGVKKLSFNGSFEKETIEQALFALKTANSFNYKIKNDEILISASK